MKVGSGAPSEVEGRHREATDCNKVIHGLIRKYGYEMVRYVTGRVIEGERRKRALNLQIREARKDLKKLESERRRGRY